MYWRFSLFALGVLLLASPQATAQKKKPGDRKAFGAAALLKRFDKNKDGYLQKTELPPQAQRRFAQMDLNKDGKVSLQELQKRRLPQKGKGRPGEINTPPARGERVQTSLKVGVQAPDFTLPTLNAKESITLSDYRGKKPVVLIFGSYT